MSKIINDPRFAACYRLLSRTESKNLNCLIVIPLCLARVGLSRFVAGSRNPLPGGL
jgi:hypothetical protein